MAVVTVVFAATGPVKDMVRDALAPHDPPSTLLGVAALGYTDQLVEVDAAAALPG